MRKIFYLFWRLGISIILLFVIFRKIDFQTTFNVIADLDWFNFLIGVIIYLILYVLVFIRWKMLLDVQGVRIPVLLVLSSFSGGVFFNLFLPSTIGGDVSRTIHLSAHTKSRSIIAASVFLDRLSGFVGLALVALLSLALGYGIISEPSVYWIVLLMASMLGCILLIIFNKGVYGWLNRSIHKKNLIDKVRKLHAEIYFFRAHPVALGLNLFYSVIVQAGCAVFAYFILRSLGVKINIFYPLVFSPVITLITALPISLGGLGLRDMSSVFFYAKAGVSQDTALAMSMLNFAVITVFGIIGGIIYVSTINYRRVQLNQAKNRL